MDSLLFEGEQPFSVLSRFPCILPVWDAGSPTGLALQCAAQLEGRIVPSGLLTTVRWSIVSTALQLKSELFLHALSSLLCLNAGRDQSD